MGATLRSMLLHGNVRLIQPASALAGGEERCQERAAAPLLRECCGLANAISKMVAGMLTNLSGIVGI